MTNPTKPEKITSAHPTRAKRFVGYVRVSTPQQALHGNSLDAQSDQLREYCHQAGALLLGIYGDAASASKPESQERQDLLDAIKSAKDQSASLLVSSIDRLSRNPDDLRLLNIPGLSVFSADKGHVSKAALNSLIHRAASEIALHSNRMKKSHAEKKARGEKSGNTKTLPVAQRNGSIANSLRSETKIMELADFLEGKPDARDLSHKELADLLNRSGILNRTSERLSGRKEWTTGSLRKPRAKAMNELSICSEMDSEDHDLSTSSFPASFSAPASDIQQSVPASGGKDLTFGGEGSRRDPSTINITGDHICTGSPMAIPALIPSGLLIVTEN